MRKPRAGLLALYVPFYEKIADLRDEKLAFAASLAERLADEAEVCWPGMVVSVEDAWEAGELFRQEQVDAAVVAPSLAVFGALGWAALETLDVPVALWSVQPASQLPEQYDIRELIRNSGNLGVEALANTLARSGRFYKTFFSGEKEDVPAGLLAFLRVAAVAADLRSATFGRIGSVFPEMTDVQMDAAAWTAAMGPRVVDIGPDELTTTYRSVEDADVGARLAEMKSSHAISNISKDELSRSARLSLALDRIVDRHGLDGGAFNCHGENCLGNQSIGVTGCYAVSRQTSEGRPFSCTGDLPTGVALFMMKRLAGAAIYGELDFVDPTGDFVVVANGGEGDLQAAEGPADLTGNENFEGIHGRGASPRVRGRPGPATLLSFTPLDGDRGYRMIAAAGEIVEREIAGLNVFHQGFRFDGFSAVHAFERWCDAGAVHHLALAPGTWTAELNLLARMLKFEFIQVGSHRET